MKNSEIQTSLETISKSLVTAEAEAKKLADAFPAHGAAQTLRGRCRSALEMAGAVIDAPPVEAPEAEPAKK